MRSRIMMLRYTICLALTVLMVSGCAFFSPERTEYVGSRSAEPLEVPDDLDRPDASSELTIQSGDQPPVSRPLEQTAPPRVLGYSADPDAINRLSYGIEGLYLQLDDTVASTYRRLGLAINRSNIEMLDEAPDEGYYLIRYRGAAPEEGFFEKMLFWRDNGNPANGDYRLQVRPNPNEAGQSHIYLRNEDGSVASDLAAETILTVFLERLG